MKQTQSKTMYLLGSFALLGLMTFGACKKNDNEPTDLQLEQIQYILQSQQHLIGGAVQLGQGAQEKGSGFTGVQADDRCGSFTAVPADPTVFPKTLTFDFGTGCTDWAGVTRSGSFVLELQKLWEPGSSSSVKYTNYTENGVVLDGSLSFSNTSTILGLGFGFNATSLKRVETTGQQSTLEAGLTFNQVAGAGTFWVWQDDVYEVKGTSSYVLSTGESATLTITTPLKKSNDCQWASEGKAEITLNGALFSIDYGNGICDNKAQVIINGVTYGYNALTRFNA